MRVPRSTIRILLAAAVLSSDAHVVQAQRLSLDSALVLAVGHHTRIWRVDRSRPPIVGSPQFIHDSTLTVLLPNDELTTVQLHEIARIAELERMPPPNLLYFRFGGIVAGAIAGAIVGHNVGITSQHTGFAGTGPRVGSVIGAIGGAFLGGLVGSAIGSVSHPRERWVTVFRR